MLNPGLHGAAQESDTLVPSFVLAYAVVGFRRNGVKEGPLAPETPHPCHCPQPFLLVVLAEEERRVISRDRVVLQPNSRLVYKGEKCTLVAVQVVQPVEGATPS